jgi:hypothetical protein
MGPELLLGPGSLDLVSASPNDSTNRSLHLNHVLENIGWIVASAAFVGGGFVLTAAIGQSIRHLWRQLIVRLAAPQAVGEDARAAGAFIFIVITALQAVGGAARIAWGFIVVAIIWLLMLRLQGLL